MGKRADNADRQRARSLLEGFARSEAGPLYTFLRRAVGDDEVARDLLQDTYLDAWRNIASYDPRRPFRPWVFGIGQNRLRNFLRRRALERRTVQSLQEEPLTPQASPSAPMSRLERQRGLEAALLRLPHRQRIIVLLRYQEGLSCAQIGQILSLTSNAVSICLHKARRQMRGLLRTGKALP